MQNVHKKQLDGDQPNTTHPMFNFLTGLLFLYIWPASSTSRSCENDILAATTPARFSAKLRTFFLEDTDSSNQFYLLPFSTDLPANETLYPVAGDFGGVGFDGLGVFQALSATFAIKYNTSPGSPDLSFPFGSPAPPGSLLPVAGDWEGSGTAGVGLWERASGTFYLKNTLTPGPADATFVFLPPGAASDPGAVPIAGDFAGHGMSTVGVYSPAAGTFYIRTQNAPGPPDFVIQYGPSNGLFMPLIGRWRGSPFAHDGLGVWQGDKQFFLKYDLSAGAADIDAPVALPNSNYGTDAMLPLAGRWAPTHCRNFTTQSSTSPTSPPPWAAGAIFYQLRIETFSPEGTFDGAIARLGYLAALGVTAIVTTPVAEGVAPGEPITPNTILYGVRRPDVVEGNLGGGAGLARFVAAAHALGLKVLVDNVVNGILQSSPYLPTNPDFAFGVDAARRNQSGDYYIEWGRNVQYDWTNPSLRRWWVEELCTKWVQEYGVDGFRIDLEPSYGNAPLWQAVRTAVLAATGKVVLQMSEVTPGYFTAHGAGPRGWTFDVSQHDFDFAGFPSAAWPDFYSNASTSFVSAVKGCGEPQATRTLSNHDYFSYSVHGRLSAFIYGTLISPFSPHFFMGEEFNHALNFSVGGNNVLYFQLMDWEGQLAHNATHQAFLAAVTRAIDVRRRYLHVFGPDPAGVVPINQTVTLDALPATGTDLEPYIFWRATTHQAVCVLAKRDTPGDGPVTVTAFPGLAASLNVPPQQNMAVVELLTGVSVLNTTASALEQGGIGFPVAQGGAAVLLIQPIMQS